MIRSLFFKDFHNLSEVIGNENILLTFGDVDGDSVKELIACSSNEDKLVILKKQHRYEISFENSARTSRYQLITTCHITDRDKENIVILTVDGILTLIEIINLSNVDACLIKLAKQSFEPNISVMTLSSMSQNDHKVTNLALGRAGNLSLYSFDMENNRFMPLCNYSFQGNIQTSIHSMDILCEKYILIGLVSGAVCVLHQIECSESNERIVIDDNDNSICDVQRQDIFIGKVDHAVPTRLAEVCCRLPLGQSISSAMVRSGYKDSYREEESSESKTTVFVFAIAWMDGRISICKVIEKHGPHVHEERDVEGRICVDDSNVCVEDVYWTVVYTVSTSDPLVHLDFMSLQQGMGTGTVSGTGIGIGSVFVSCGWNGRTYIIAAMDKTMVNYDDSIEQSSKNQSAVYPLRVFHFDMSLMSGQWDAEEYSVIKAGAVRYFYCANLPLLGTTATPDMKDILHSDTTASTTPEDVGTSPSLVYVMASGAVWQVTGIRAGLVAAGPPTPEYVTFNSDIVNKTSSFYSDIARLEADGRSGKYVFPEGLSKVLFPNKDDQQCEEDPAQQATRLLERLLEMSPSEFYNSNQELQTLLNSQGAPSCPVSEISTTTAWKISYMPEM
eukprot:gene5743-11612_t